MQDQHLALLQFRRAHIQVGKCVGRLQGRDDALQLGQKLEGLERLRVCDGIVLCALGVLQPAVLGTYPGVVQPAEKEDADTRDVAINGHQCQLHSFDTIAECDCGT